MSKGNESHVGKFQFWFFSINVCSKPHLNRTCGCREQFFKFNVKHKNLSPLHSMFVTQNHYSWHPTFPLSLHFRMWKFTHPRILQLLEKVFPQAEIYIFACISACETTHYCVIPHGHTCISTCWNFSCCFISCFWRNTLMSTVPIMINCYLLVEIIGLRILSILNILWLENIKLPFFFLGLY